MADTSSPLLRSSATARTRPTRSLTGRLLDRLEKAMEQANRTETPDQFGPESNTLLRSRRYGNLMYEAYNAVSTETDIGVQPPPSMGYDTAQDQREIALFHRALFSGLSHKGAGALYDIIDMLEIMGVVWGVPARFDSENAH